MILASPLAHKGEAEIYFIHEGRSSAEEWRSAIGGPGVERKKG